MAQENGDLILIVLRQSLTFTGQYTKNDGFTSKFDISSKKYIYHLRLIKPLDTGIQFTKVETGGEKINFITDNSVKCLSCQKDTDNPYNLVPPPGGDSARPTNFGRNQCSNFFKRTPPVKTTKAIWKTPHTLKETKKRIRIMPQANKTTNHDHL